MNLDRAYVIVNKIVVELKIFMEELYKEALYMSEIYGIPKVVVDDYFEMFVQFVREELKYRLKYGNVKHIIEPQMFITILMQQAEVC